MKSLKVQLSSRKVSAHPWGVLRPKSLIRGVLHLATMCLLCEVLGWEQPVPGRGLGVCPEASLSHSPAAGDVRGTSLWLPQACTLFPDVLS